jgi:simple sugar transport system ATP-binding protein
MRDARVITTKDAGELTDHDIAYLMVGREISFERVPPPEKKGETFLSVHSLSYINDQNTRILNNISFEVNSGEILGLAGVEGNGQTELVQLLTGLLKPLAGEILIKGENVDGFSPRKIRERKVAHIPEDRMENGVAEQTTLEENFIVDRYYTSPFSRRFSLDWKKIGTYSNELMERFRILAQSSRAPVSSLSGGNIQKVVVARELSSEPEVIIAAQPTRGIDIGSEEMVHNLLKEVRDQGKAIFLISADLDEILKLSTRIIVIYNGEIVAHFKDVAGISGKELGPYMLGVKREEGVSGKIHS